MKQPSRRGGRPKRHMRWTTAPMPREAWERGLPKLTDLIEADVQAALERGDLVQVDRGDYVEIVPATAPRADQATTLGPRSSVPSARSRR